LARIGNNARNGFNFLNDQTTTATEFGTHATTGAKIADNRSTGGEAATAQFVAASSLE
jgi:hypothetical protein